MPASLTRREALQSIGAVGLGALASACGSGGGQTDPPSRTASPAPAAASTPLATATPSQSATPTPATSPTPSATPTNTPPSTPTGTTTPAITVAQPACVLTPEQTEGPYFLDVSLLRQDIIEDRVGVPVQLMLQIVDADGCSPIRDAVVNVWHADANGLYSGFAGQLGGVDTRGATFLRGYQVTDADGRVEFATIYPGWYPGRTVHIHFKVHFGSTSEVTSQLYFPESTTDAVYAQSPYNSRGTRDTSNVTDSVVTQSGLQSLNDLTLAVGTANGTYSGAIVVGVAL